MPQISIFENISKVSNPDSAELLDYLADTKDGRWQDLVSAVRVEKEKTKRDELKRKMPTTTLSGLFSYRSDSKILEHSGYINMDIDEIEGDINEIKDKFMADPSVFSVFLSTSGNGLRVMFKIVPKEHKRSFYGISEYISKVYGLVCDPGSLSISKPFVVSFDPDLFINEKASVWTRYPRETVLKKEITFVHTPTDFKEVFNNIVNRGVNICEEYADWLKLGFCLAEQFGEEGREYFHRLSMCSSKYKHERTEKQFTYCLKSKGSGVNISTFYYLAKANGINIVSEKTKLIIKTVINGRKAGLKVDGILKNLKDNHGIQDADEVVNKTFDDDSIKLDAEDDNVVDQFEMYIATNFNLRKNEITGYFEEGRIRKSQDDLNTIFKDAKKKIQKIDYTLMMRILNSDFIPKYNPFYDFLGSDGVAVELPPMTDPENNSKFESPLIDELASCLVNDSPIYTKYFFRKWIVGIVSSMHKRKSPLFLALLGPQGTGKTHFLRNLLPKELQDYFVQTKLDKGKDSEFELCENIIAFDDEMYGKTQKESVLFNALIDQQWFSLRRPYGTHNEKTLAYAVWCGTSNYYDVIKDPTGNRRIIPIDVQDINKEKYNSINKADLFLEAFKIYKMGFDWRVISKEDKEFLNQDLVKYEMSNFERELIEKYFQPAEVENLAVRLSTTEIKIELERFTRQNLNLKVLGQELNKKDKDGNARYIQKSTRQGPNTVKKWLVDRINRGDDLPSNFLPPDR
jgi:predicted P-loop ATPase